jgi:DnaJ-related protein SCJ1
LEVKYTRNMICPHCRGSGADDPNDIKECPKCGGQGVTIETKRLGPGFVQQFQTTCNQCQGKGKLQTSRCHVCDAKQTKQALDELFLYIERGTPDGHEERFKDAADEFVDMRAGEVVFKIQQLPHPRFKRKGDDLLTTVEISLK